MAAAQSANELRERAKILNERAKLVSGVFANGGLAMIAGGAGIIWAEWDKGVPVAVWLLVMVGVIVIMVGVGLLDAIRLED